MVGILNCRHTLTLVMSLQTDGNMLLSFRAINRFLVFPPTYIPHDHRRAANIIDLIITKYFPLIRTNL